MRTVFADSGYWIALLNPRDALHEKAKAVSASLGPVRYATSEMVLTECLNYFADQGEHLRAMVATLVQQVREDPNTVVVPQTSVQFQGALSSYAARNDKAWSHTDCASFNTMHDMAITEALAHDRHFTQAGFRALLREDG